MNNSHTFQNPINALQGMERNLFLPFRSEIFIYIHFPSQHTSIGDDHFAGVEKYLYCGLGSYSG